MRMTPLLHKPLRNAMSARVRGCTFAAARLSAGPGSWPLILRADFGLQDFEDDEMSCVCCSKATYYCVTQSSFLLLPG